MLRSLVHMRGVVCIHSFYLQCLRKVKGWMMVTCSLKGFSKSLCSKAWCDRFQVTDECNDLLLQVLKLNFLPSKFNVELVTCSINGDGPCIQESYAASRKVHSMVCCVALVIQLPRNQFAKVSTLGSDFLSKQIDHPWSWTLYNLTNI